MEILLRLCSILENAYQFGTPTDSPYPNSWYFCVVVIIIIIIIIHQSDMYCKLLNLLLIAFFFFKEGSVEVVCFMSPRMILEFGRHCIIRKK